MKNNTSFTPLERAVLRPESSGRLWASTKGGSIRGKVPSFLTGFTLVEILLALAILGVGLVGILSVFVVGANTVRRAVEKTEACFIAQIVFEDFKRQGHANPSSFIVPALPAHYTNNPNPDLIYAVPGPAVNDVNPNVPNLKRVDINVNKGNRTIAQFTTYIAQYEP